MKTITASDFKARCLALMDEVERTGEPLVITKRGREVSKLVAIQKRPASIFGALKGRITILGDIVSPTGDEWDAERT